MFCKNVTHVSTHIISTYYFVSIRHNFHFLFPFSNCTPQFRFAIRFPLIISFHYYTISTSYSRFPIAGHHSALRLGFHLLFRFTITQFPLLIPVFDFSISISLISGSWCSRYAAFALCSLCSSRNSIFLTMSCT